MDALILGVRDIRNVGDLAILKAEKRVLERGCGFSRVAASIDYHEVAKVVEPDLEIYPALIDAKVVQPTHSGVVVAGQRLWLLFVWLLQMITVPLLLILAKLGVSSPYKGSLYRYIRQCDAIFFTGGNYLFEVGSKTDTSRLDKVAARYLFMAGVAWQLLWIRWIFGTLIVGFPQSIGLFKSGLGKMFGRWAIRSMDLCFLRERESGEVAEQLQVGERCITTIDMAFFLEAAPVRLDLEGPVMIVAPRLTAKVSRKSFVDAHVAAVRYWIETVGGMVVFMPSHELGAGTRDDDCKISRDIIEQCDSTRMTYVSCPKAELYKGFLRRADVVLSTRMHPTILAASSEVPYVAVYYEHKQIGLADQLGMKDFLVDIENVSGEGIISRLERLLREYDGIRRGLRERLEDIKKEEGTIVEEINRMTDAMKGPRAD